jgi:hypothetical protein
MNALLLVVFPSHSYDVDRAIPDAATLYRVIPGVSCSG